jgi:hypothetical protein
MLQTNRCASITFYSDNPSINHAEIQDIHSGASAAAPGLEASLTKRELRKRPFQSSATQLNWPSNKGAGHSPARGAHRGVRGGGRFRAAAKAQSAAARALDGRRELPPGRERATRRASQAERPPQQAGGPTSRRSGPRAWSVGRQRSSSRATPGRWGRSRRAHRRCRRSAALQHQRGQGVIEPIWGQLKGK